MAIENLEVPSNARDFDHCKVLRLLSQDPDFTDAMAAHLHVQGDSSGADFDRDGLH